MSCERIGIKDFSRVCSLSHYMNGGPFAKTETLGDQTCSFIVCGEKGKREIGNNDSREFFQAVLL